MAKHKRTRHGKGSQLARELSRHPTRSGFKGRDGVFDSIVRPPLKPRTLAQVNWTRGKRVR